MATAADVKKFFGMSMTEFKEEWGALSDEEKEYFRTELAKVS